MKTIISNLDKAFESRIRLGIMSILMVNEWVDFRSLKEYLEITDGNLASHLKSLSEKDIIEMKKQFISRKPNTSYRATDYGENLFKQHITALEHLLKG